MKAFHPQPVTDQLTLSELIAALSRALDITEGQPPGHCIRVCWIGVHIAKEMEMPEQEIWDLYYTLLLKDLGCSSNAARICELYMTDDLSFKRNYKTVSSSLPQVVRFVLKNTGLKKGLAERFKTVFNVMQNGEDLSRELIQTRCDRGAEIAHRLRFSDAVSEGIRCLDEHWDGGGKPAQLSQEDLPVFSRIALLSQVVDVFHESSDRENAIQEVKLRSGTWFDPAIVAVFEKVAQREAFWLGIEADDVHAQILSLEPAACAVEVDDDYLDEIAAAFGEVVDSKSPYTAGHSERVALYTDIIAKELGFDEGLRRWLKRGALLHDVGKLGVSNSILDKPGKLDEEEWVAMRKHPVYTEEILSKISAFSELARVSGAHHERMDGKGYPKGLVGDEITMATRVITTADIFDAITADRPYRAAIPVDKALSIMEESLDVAIDRECFAALKLAVMHNAFGDCELKAG